MKALSVRILRGRLQWMTLALAILALVLGGRPAASAGPAASAATNPDSLGTDFWLAFPGNYSGGTLTLFITGPTATSGTVTMPGVAFSAPFTVTPGTVTSVPLPAGSDIQTSDTVENLGIHVTADAEVTVYGLNQITASTDAYLGLPTDILGTEYLVEGYENVDIVEGTEFAVVATQDGTTVTINPTVTTNGHTAGTPYTVSLDQGHTYQLRNEDAHPADLSGSIVTSDKPIAVFGGHQCANIPMGYYACDHIVEELPPTSTWGKSFVTEPLATRTGGDTFRYLADTDNTTVQVNGAPVATLNRGQLFEQILTAPSVITSDKPILVTQYSNSTTFDGATSDPFEVLVPPFEQFLNSYTVTTPATGFTENFINVVAPTASLATINLDGVPVPGGSFTPIPDSTFSAAQLAVALGSHTLDGAQPFGVTVYGFAQADSYGYPGGLSLAPVATVTSVTLAPEDATNPINTEHCVTASVKDQNDDPVVGVRVDFSVTGVNPTNGFGNTAADGTANFCYTGTNPGSDTITAAVGPLSDTAMKLWTTATPTATATPTPTATATPTPTPTRTYTPTLTATATGTPTGTSTATAAPITHRRSTPTETPMPTATVAPAPRPPQAPAAMPQPPSAPTAGEAGTAQYPLIALPKTGAGMDEGHMSDSLSSSADASWLYPTAAVIGLLGGAAIVGGLRMRHLKARSRGRPATH